MYVLNQFICKLCSSIIGLDQKSKYVSKYQNAINTLYKSKIVSKTSRQYFT